MEILCLLVFFSLVGAIAILFYDIASIEENEQQYKEIKGSKISFFFYVSIFI